MVVDNKSVQYTDYKYWYIIIYYYSILYYDRMVYYFILLVSYNMIKDLFIDRTTYLQSLTNGLQHGKDYILIAPRRYGKTTLAQKILDKLKSDSNYLTIQIDIMRYSGSIQSIAEGIIENCLNAIGIIGKLKLWLKQIEFSFKIKIKYSNLEIEPLLQLVRNQDDEWTLLEQSLQLIETIALKTNKKLIVFFDEFGELYSLGERAIKIFRSVIQLHKQVTYLFAGSQETLMSKIFVEGSGAFYRFGDLVWLKELERIEVIELLNEMKITYEVMDAVLQKFNCHPYYTSKIIKDFIIAPNYASSMEEFFYYIDNVLIPQESAYLELQLQKIKEKSHALDIVSNLALNLDPYDAPISKQSVYNTLKNLELSGFITKVEKAKYIIADPLIKLYLSH